MDLEKLTQEAEKLKTIDPTTLSVEQLSELVDRMYEILGKSEESFIDTVNKNMNNEPNNNL